MDLSGFHKEWLGQSKTNETIWSAVSGILKQFKRHRYGGVRMNFGQPFSAKEMLRALNLKDTPDVALNQESDSDSTQDRIEACSMTSQSSIPDFKSIEITQQEFLPPTSKKVIEKVVTLSVYKSQEISSIMSTHLVAFLLLNKFRTGTSIDKFTSAFQYMTEKINGGVVYPNLSLGFQSTPEQALKSFNYLFPNLIEITSNQSEAINQVSSKNSEAQSNVLQKSTVRCRFDTSRPIVAFELCYLSNLVACRLTKEAVLSIVLLKLSGLTLETLLSQHTNISVSRARVIQQCVLLSLLQDAKLLHR